jgi:hypothetical protein
VGADLSEGCWRISTSVLGTDKRECIGVYAEGGL